jgi:AAA15 family ATPase/GTPase
MERQLALPPRSAVVAFSATNVRSYRDPVNFSLVATRVADPAVVRELPWGAGGRTYRLLPAAGVFGANASGKSTLLRAIADMRTLVLGSFRHGHANSPIPRRAFALDESWQKASSSFEIELVFEGVRWQYGFEVDDHTVVQEYAYHYPNGRRATVFDRTGSSFEYGPVFRPSLKVLEALVRPNSLLLSVAGAASPTPLLPLFAWFERNLLLATSDNRPVRAARTADLAERDEFRARVLAFLAAADLGVVGVSRAEITPDIRARIQQALPLLLGRDLDPETEAEFVIEDFIQLVHRGTAGDVVLDAADESIGTLVWFSLAAAVIEALDGGHVLLADELDASLHPKLVALLISLFQNPSTNPRCAQLIFNAHDVTVLGDSEHRLLGRDQIWFTEKGADGTTTLYSLAEFSPRNDEALERRYLQGRFGALPVLDHSAFERAAVLESVG